MDELTRLKTLFSDHYDGSPWLEVNIVDTLGDVSAEQAARKMGNHNSIWQIVVHLIAWREANLKRVQGEIFPAPANNFIEEIKDTSEAAWQQVMEKLKRSQEHILAYLAQADTATFDHVYKANSHTYYEHVQGILQHDAYHLGQIVLLKKLFLPSSKTT